MANYESLKAAIAQVIKTNGNNEITGAILQNVLFSMLNTISNGNSYLGEATPATNPGTPDNNVFYLFIKPGTYSNFGGIVQKSGEISIVRNTTNGWVRDIINTVSYSVISNNIHNPATDLLNTSITNTGVIVTGTAYNVSDFINVEPNKSYTGIGATLRRAIEFDSMGNVVVANESINTFTTSPTTTQIRLQYINSVQPNVVRFGLSDTDYSDEYAAKIMYLGIELLTEFSDVIVELSKQLNFVMRNLQNPATVLLNSSLQANGTVIASNDYTTTDFIPVDSGKSYKCDVSMRRCLEYADNQVNIIAVHESITSLTTYGSTKYVRFMYSNTNDPNNVHFGLSDIDNNVPYGEYMILDKYGDEILTPNSPIFDVINQRIDEVDGKIIYKGGDNLHNPATDSLNTSISNDGVITPGTAYNLTDYINVSPNTLYNVVLGTAPTMRRVIEYNAAGTIIQATEKVTSITTQAATTRLRFIYSNVATPETVRFGKAGTYFNQPYSERAYDRYDNKLLIASDVVVAENEGLITLQNSDKILIMGSSNAESHYTVKNKSFFMRLNDIQDWLFVTYAFSGNSAAQLAAKLIANTPAPTASGLTPDKIHPSYVLVGQYGNMSEAGMDATTSDQFIEENRKLALVAESVFNAKLLIGSGYTAYGYAYLETAMKGLADELGADYIPWGIYNDNIINNRRYAGFWGNAHPGTRTNNMAYQEAFNYFEKWQKPNQSIKMFKPRTGTTDYNYRDNLERAQKFYSIQVGEQSLPDDKIGYYDRLQTSDDYTPFAKNQSEYFALMQGNSVNFGNVLAVEIMLPVICADSVNVYVNSSEALTIQLYNNKTNVFDTQAVTSDRGLYTIPVNSAQYISHDKIKLLLSGNVVLTNVYCKFIGGRKKQRIDKTTIQDYATSKIAGGVGFPDTWTNDWTNSGAITYYKQLDRYGSIDFVDIPSYQNSFNGNILELLFDATTIKSIDRTFTTAQLYGDRNPANPLNLRIELYARMWTKIYDPERFAAWTGENNPYTDQQRLTADTYDFGTLCVGVRDTANRLAIMEKPVGMFWSRVTFDIYLPPFSSDKILRIFRKVNDINPDMVLEISDIIISVK